jgi:hypothetical protein
MNNSSRSVDEKVSNVFFWFYRKSGEGSNWFANQKVLEILPGDYSGAKPDVGYNEFGIPTALRLVKANGSANGHAMILLGTLLIMAFVSLAILQRSEAGLR